MNLDCDYDSFSKSMNDFIQEKEFEFLTTKIKSEASIRKAAQKLNLSKSALHRKMVSLGFTGKEVYKKATP